MTSPLERYAQRQAKTKRAAEAVSFVNGVAAEDPVDGWVRVDIGGAVRKAKVPGSVYGVRADRMVRLSRQQNTLIVDSILSAMPTPTVAAPPSASGISPGVNGTGSSGCYDASSGDAFSYARDVAAVTRALAGDINELRGDVGDHASDIASLKTTVNSLRTTVDALRSALVAQGHVV